MDGSQINFVSKSKPLIVKSANIKPANNEGRLPSISPKFYERVFCIKVFKQLFLPTFYLCKFLAPKFRTKNAHVDRWWNWHLYTISDRERKCSNSKRRKRQSFIPCPSGFVPDLKNGHCYKALGILYEQENAIQQCQDVNATPLQFYSEVQLQSFLALLASSKLSKVISQFFIFLLNFTYDVNIVKRGWNEHSAITNIRL